MKGTREGRGDSIAVVLICPEVNECRGLVVEQCLERFTSSLSSASDPERFARAAASAPINVAPDRRRVPAEYYK